MQNDVQKVKSVRFWSGILYVSPDNWASRVNLGALSDATLTANYIINEFVVDNAKLPPQQKLDEVLFSANLYEFALDNFQLIDGFAEYSTLDWTPVAVTGESLGTGWTVNQPIKLANKNGDNTEVASITIYADWAPLGLDTDYRVYVDADWYTYILPIAVQTGVLDADYTYTPLANKQQIYKDVMKTLKQSRFKFENEDADWKIFGIEFYQWYNRAGITATFVPDDATDDALNVPIEIKAYPQTSTQNMFRIYDEQDLS